MSSAPVPEIFGKSENRLGIIVGCGPSLDIEQLAKVSHLKRFGANRTFEFDLDVVLGCNYQFWDHYWPEIKDYRCDKWTTRPQSAEKYGINYIEERWEGSLSTDKSYVCAHHGSGPQILNMALHYGCKTMLLIGWDMRYPGKINTKKYTGKRHYFGGDPLTEGHWPQTGPDGELAGLIREMETIRPEILGVDIINCTAGSAMTCFPMMSLDAALKKYDK